MRASIVASGIVAILSGLNLLNIATSMTLKPHIPGGASEFIIFARISGALLTVCAAFGIATAVALFKHKRWARIAIQGFGVALAVISIPAGAGVLVAGTASPELARSARYFAHLLIYPAQIVIAIWWLILFNTRTAKNILAA